MNELEKTFGGRWYGVSVFGLDVACKEDFSCPQVNNLCEALKIATTGKVLIKPCEFSCVGARYAFGCGERSREAIVEQIIERHGFSRGYSETVVEHTPHCEVEAGSIGIGIQEHPSVWVARLQPAQVMALVNTYQARFERSCQPEISNVVSICSTVVVGALQKQDMTFAMGCEASRESGCLTSDRLFVGLPANMATKLAS